ncbi:hypothetical protein BJ508DRAFT_208309 [Ascobolus immersus RN42]|uniref:GEgh 16 protein n=1 Tax=Ascobolus immersus RN42 TaxID=1160509 RepID=A0A3N4IA98_ASCIM|nr:hypothetical protein BJ508DRAFT_208309 [Ascobolus immersus RN42]
MQSFISIASVAFIIFQTVAQVAGHGAIINAVGNVGGQGRALAVDPSTPRDGTRRRPFQQDSTRFRSGPTGCGETLQNGEINIASSMSALVNDMGGLPQVTAGGELTMTLHQVNADGAGPYTCMIDMSGTGASYTSIVVTQNVPGSRRGRNRDGEASDFPLVAQLPANMQCTGSMAGMTGICMVRCQNPARAGPFGGCVPIQQVQDAPPAVAPVDAPNDEEGVAPVDASAAAGSSRSGSSSGSVANGVSRFSGRIARGLVERERAMAREAASDDDSEEECD